MEKKFIYISFVIIIFTGNLFSQLLWKVSSEDGKYNSYIFGTIHLRDKKVFSFNTNLLSFLNSSEIFACELNMDEVLKEESTYNFSLPEGKSLKDFYSEKDYEIMNKKFQELTGYSLEIFDKLKPVTLLIFLSQIFYNNDSKLTLDEYLQSVAKKKNLEIVGLERVKDQFSLLERITPEDVRDYIINAEKERLQRESERLLNLYLSENLEEIQRLIEEEDLFTPFDRLSLLDERNFKLVDRLVPLFEKTGVFCAIGAGHLVGSNGMISLLRSKGFNVEPVQNKIFSFTLSSNWVKFEDERFISLFPEMPYKSVEFLQIPFGMLKFDVWSSDFYSIMITECPEYMVLLLGGEEAVFNIAINKVAETMKCKILSSKKINISKKEAKEIQFVFEDNSKMFVRTVLYKGYLFILQAFLKDEKEMLRFFESFELK